MVSINSILSSTSNRLLQREELYTTTQNSLSATWYLRTLAKLFVFLWQLYWEYLILLYLWVKVAYISFIGPLSFKYELYMKMPHLISLCKSRQHAHLFLWRTWMLLIIVLAIFLSIGWSSCKTRLSRMRLCFIAWGKSRLQSTTTGMPSTGLAYLGFIMCFCSSCLDTWYNIIVPCVKHLPKFNLLRFRS